MKTVWFFVWYWNLFNYLKILRGGKQSSLYGDKYFSHTQTHHTLVRCVIIPHTNTHIHEEPVRQTHVLYFVLSKPHSHLDLHLYIHLLVNTTYHSVILRCFCQKALVKNEKFVLVRIVYSPPPPNQCAHEFDLTGWNEDLECIRNIQNKQITDWWWFPRKKKRNRSVFKRGTARRERVRQT